MPRSLITLNQIADPLRISLPVPKAGDGIGPAGRLNTNRRPDQPGRNRDRRNLSDCNTFVIAAEGASLHAAHPQRADHDAPLHAVVERLQPEDRERNTNAREI